MHFSLDSEFHQKDETWTISNHWKTSFFAAFTRAGARATRCHWIFLGHFSRVKAKAKAKDV